MFSRIAHVAIYTENYQKMAGFYKTIFNMKQITTNAADASGKPRTDLGHISDGVIGLALLKRNAGIRSGLDHFGFDVEDIETAVGRIRADYPEVLIKSELGDTVPFVSTRAHDPVGTFIDISQKEAPNVREGYAEDRWDQPRHFHHVSIRAFNPGRLAEFYRKVFELEELESAEDHRCLTDGKSYLVIRSCHTGTYTTMREGLDHMGFRVESLEKVKSALSEIGRALPQSVPRRIAGGRFGDAALADLEACGAGRYGTADPDGVLLHLSE